MRLFLAMKTIRHQPSHQLDIKNVFLHDDLEEEIYAKQLPICCSWEVWFGL